MLRCSLNVFGGFKNVLWRVKWWNMTFCRLCTAENANWKWSVSGMREDVVVRMWYFILDYRLARWWIILKFTLAYMFYNIIVIKSTACGTMTFDIYPGWESQSEQIESICIGDVQVDWSWCKEWYFAFSFCVEAMDLADILGIPHIGLLRLQIMVVRM